MTIKNYISILSLTVSISVCGQTNTNENNKDGIKFNERPPNSSTDNLSAKENYNIGYKAFHSEDYRKAISYYRKAIQLDPKFSDAMDNCGIAYRRLGNLDSAAYFYKESIKINPEGMVAHGNLAIIYSHQGKYEDAIKEYEEISKYNPNDPEAPYGIAGVYLIAKQYDKALISAKKSVELFEKYAPKYVGDAYYYVGLSYLKLNDKSNAKDYFQKAIEKGTSVSADLKAKAGMK